MRAWLPQSLFARLLAAVLGVIGITLAIIMLLVLRERRDLALWGSSAWSAAAVIAETSEKLAHMRPEERRAAIAKYRAESIEIESTRRGPPPQLSRTIEQSQEVFARRLRRQLSDDYRVTVTPLGRRPAQRPIRVLEEWRRPAGSDAGQDSQGSGPGDDRGPPPNRDGGPPPGEGPRNGARPGFGPFASRLIDVSVRLPDGERVMFRTIAPMPGPPLPTEIIAQVSAWTLALAIVLGLMTRTITRPLSELASAAEAIGKGVKIPPLRESGARELRDATRAFNTMQDRLHRYLDSRTRVLAAMSHDLRTPLTRLRLRAEALDDGETRERFTADLDEMTLMVNGALGLFKGLNDNEVPVNISIDDLLASLQKEFAELGETVSVTGRSRQPISAKPGALKRCLSNLLHNAIKYGDRASVVVTDGATLRISVLDEGPGIAEEFQRQVFEPFYRLESSRNRDSGGTGLGLCIAKDIAEAHGGTIELRNRPEGGLEATLSLPRP
ncbi:MAG: ATP-binding protein [Steroidobacteraceae bacterium]